MENMENLIAHSNQEKSLCKTILPIVEKDDFELVRIKVFEGSNFTIQVMIEHNTRSLTIDDCAAISRIISDELDKKKIIKEEYNLEVSSPGLDRPLTRLKDFNAWKGHKVIIKQKTTDLKNSKLKGILIGMLNSELQVIQNNKIIYIKVCNIKEAKLVS